MRPAGKSMQVRAAASSELSDLILCLSLSLSDDDDDDVDVQTVASLLAAALSSYRSSSSAARGLVFNRTVNFRRDMNTT